MAKAKTPRSTSKINGGTSPGNGTPAVHPENISEIKEVRKVTAEARPNVVPINLDDEIRRRAYELWEQHGREPGHENEHWLLAEREIRARYSSERQQSA